MVETGLLVNHQEVPLAPWEIMKADIDSPQVKAVLNHLKQTGELITKGCHIPPKSTRLIPDEFPGRWREIKDVVVSHTDGFISDMRSESEREIFGVV
jgi:hypothetical protein